MRHNTGKLLTTGVFALILFILPSLCWAWRARVMVVKDGDSMMISSRGLTVGVRLYGVDSPEWEQDFGRQAKHLASTLVMGKTVEFQPVDQDQYGRAVGLVYADGRCVNEELLKAGLAWFYPRYCKKSFCREWQRLEERARNNRVGLWSQRNPVPPWEYRQKEKSDRSGWKLQFPRFLGGYHGNVSSRVFHSRTCQYYNCTKCTARFWSRTEALREGYKPCSICKP